MDARHRLPATPNRRHADPSVAKLEDADSEADIKMRLKGLGYIS